MSTAPPLGMPTDMPASVRELLLARLDDVRAMQVNIPSPCVSVCRMDAAGALCLGCARTLDEIAAWSRADDAGRQAIWRRIGARLARPGADA